MSPPHPRRARRYLPSRARSLLLRLRALLWSPDQIARLAEDQMETRQQLLHESNKLKGEQAELADLAERLREELRGVSAQLQVTTDRLDAHRRETAPLGRSVAAIAEMVARLDPPDPATLADGTLVSIVLPVRDRAGIVGDAVRSVLDQTYPHWELLAVDDASSDGSGDVIARAAAGDDRVQVLQGPARGVPAARNTALRMAQGQIITYLDSDNRWLPSYLAHVVATFRHHHEDRAAVAAQLVVDDRTGHWSIRDDDRPFGDLRTANFVDLNAYSHRRDLLDELGLFDETLLRFSDWDLVLRHTAVGPMRRIPVPGSVYRSGRADQITNTEPSAWFEHLVRRKHRRQVSPRPRILCAEWHYPQLSESYLQADIDGLKALGAEVEVWSEEGSTAAPFATAEPVHRGSLEQAIADVRPDVVLTHWLNIGERLAGDVERMRVPMVVRGHGFEFDGDTLARLLARRAVRRVYLFPQFFEGLDRPDPRVRPLPASFDGDRYIPGVKQDPLLVVRGGVAIPTKAYDTFFRVASACPEHRFVLCLVHAHQLEDHLDEVRSQRDQLGAPVEIRVDVPHDEMAELVGSAGIYLHTHGLQAPFGMPVSIAESMATGSYVIARDLPGCRAYLDGAGDVYTTPAGAAALVDATLDWDDRRWRDQSNRAIDRAFSTFTNTLVAEKMLRDWRELGLVPS